MHPSGECDDFSSFVRPDGTSEPIGSHPGAEYIPFAHQCVASPVVREDLLNAVKTALFVARDNVCRATGRSRGRKGLNLSVIYIWRKEMSP